MYFFENYFQLVLESHIVKVIEFFYVLYYINGSCDKKICRFPK